MSTKKIDPVERIERVETIDEVEAIEPVETIDDPTLIVIEDEDAIDDRDAIGVLIMIVIKEGDHDRSAIGSVGPVELGDNVILPCEPRSCETARGGCSVGEYGGEGVCGRGSSTLVGGRAHVSTMGSTGRPQGFPQLTHKLVIASRDRLAVDVCFGSNSLVRKICRFVRGLHDTRV